MEFLTKRNKGRCCDCGEGVRWRIDGLCLEQETRLVCKVGDTVILVPDRLRSARCEDEETSMGGIDMIHQMEWDIQ